MKTRARHTVNSSNPRRLAWGRAAVVAAVVGLVALGGCGRNESAKALEQTRRAMLALHTGPHSASPQLRERTYRDALTTLRPIVDRLSPSQGASAVSLMGQAESGLAELHADRAGDLGSRALNRLSEARSALDTYAAQIAMSEALVRYSPDEETARLRVQEQSLDEEMSRANSARRELQDRIGALEAGIAEQRRLANAERERERAVWAGVVDAGSADRADAATRAHAIARVADGHEMRAAQLAAQVNQIKPQVALIETDIARIQRQRELIDAARRDLDARLGALRAESARARAEALSAAERFERIARDLRALRDGDFATTHNAAVNGYGAAIASFRRAVSAMQRPEARAPISLALASAQAAQASLHRSRAGLEDVVAQSVARAEALTPPMPQQALIREMRVEAETRRDESLRAAVDAYQAARSTLQGVSARGDLGERIDRIRRQVDEALSRLTGVEIPAEEDAAPATRDRRRPEPVTDEPVTDEPVDDEWTDDEPMPDEPAPDEPVDDWSDDDWSDDDSYEEPE